MSLFKKIIFGLFVAVAIGLGLWGYFGLKESKKPGVEALSLLPDSCLLYLYTPDFFELDKKLNSQSLIADKLKLFGDVNALCNTLHLFDSLLSSNTLLQEELKNTPVHFTLYEPNNITTWLVAFNLKQLGSQVQTGEALAGLFHAKQTGNGNYEFKVGNHSFYFDLGSGVVLVSNDGQQIAHARKGNSHGLQHNKTFLDFKNELEESNLLSVYVDHELYRKSKVNGSLNLSLACESGFSAGAVDLQPSQVKVNGYFAPANGELIAAFLDQQPQTPNFVNLLPASTAAFRAYGFSSLAGLKLKLDKLKEPVNKEFWKQMNDTALYDLEQEFYLNALSYAVEFEITMQQRFVALQVADTAMAMNHLKALSDSLALEGQDSLYHLAAGGHKELRLFEPLFDNATAYAARWGSCLYFAGDKSSLLQVLHQLRSGQLLSHDESFMAYSSQQFYENFNYLAYYAPNRMGAQVKQFFNFKIAATENPFENFRHFSFSLARQGKKFKFRWQLMNENEKRGEEQPVLWTLKLDTFCTMKAAGFVNHITKENELLVQDGNRMLYLVNAKGTVLWKKKINEPIRSELFMVDLFKNNKYQVVFSSQNYLHLLDRNGNYLPGYPVKLPAEATSPLSLFDYDHNRDYRLFIACKNKLIYNYALSGVKQDGFVPFRTEHEIELPIQYVKVGLSDYLVAVDTEGKIYTFSRRGDGRIGLKNRTTANCSGFCLDANNTIYSTYLVYADAANNSINKISFADKKALVKLNNHFEQASVAFGKTDGGQSPAVIFTQPDAVWVYDLNGDLLTDRPMGKELSESAVYKDENGSVLLSRSAARQELSVYDQLSQKSLSLKTSALPLVVHLFNDHKKYLVITSGSQLNCVLLN